MTETTPNQTETGQSPCNHETFNGSIDVGRITDEAGVIVYYSADITITCSQCQMRFEFIGLPYGYSPYRPTVSLDGVTMAAPVMPVGTRPPDGLSSYAVAMKDFRQ
jgi:hypothetical protein